MLNFETGDKNDYVGNSNNDVLIALNPTQTSYSLNYVYDSFDWTHCKDQENLDFSDFFRSE
jgi:hypothetical protein